jgi:predicted RNA-binding protein
LLYGDEGMGIARKDMPQIPGKERARFLSEIEAELGVTAEKEKVDPTTLKPIQKEISAARSGAIYNKFREDGEIPKNERILISKDGFVVDGHHTWGAAVAFAFDNPGTELPVYRLSVTAQEALDISSKWSKDNGFEGQAIDAPAKKSLLWEPLEKHGEHDQRTHGSWANNMVSDKEPEQGQSREAIALARGVREKAVAAEPAITKLVQAVADQSGAKLEGLSERIKSTDSLSRKIDQDAEKQYQGDRNKAAEEISDANRYTISVNDNDYADTLKSTVSAFEETGWKVRVKNFWQAGDPYDGVNVKAERDGIKVEVQVHTPKSYEIKEKALHDVYEVYRKSTDDSVRESTWNKMIGIAKRVPRPSNYATILGVGTLILQQFETAQQAGLIKSTPVGKLSHERRA